MTSSAQFMLVLKKHHRLISVAGALILFVTFLAKDAKRDRLKELGDSIDSAENAFIIRAENKRMYEALQTLGRNFDDFRRNPWKKGAGGSGRPPWWNWTFELAEARDGIKRVDNEERSSEEVLDNA